MVFRCGRAPSVTDMAVFFYAIRSGIFGTRKRTTPYVEYSLRPGFQAVRAMSTCRFKRAFLPSAPRH